MNNISHLRRKVLKAGKISVILKKAASQSVETVAGKNKLEIQYRVL